jgi:hypothetical protein
LCLKSPLSYWSLGALMSFDDGVSSRGLSGYEWRERLIIFRTSGCTLCICFGWYFVCEYSRDNGLHWTNPWGKVYLQQEILSNLLSHHYLQFSRSFWLMGISGFLYSVGWKESVRMELFVLPTLSVETHERRIRAIWPP